MNKELDNTNDLFDDNIAKSLRQLGYVFPMTRVEFKAIDEKARSQLHVIPDKLSDPFKFLNERRFNCNKNSSINIVPDDYCINLAQAAREGKTITEEVKQKMKEDKSKSRDNKKDQ